MNKNEMKKIMELYSDEEYEYQENRYSQLLENFRRHFPENNISFFSSPGRTELGGNHTDHNHGRVLAAAVNLDTVAAAAPVTGSTVSIFSDGYPPLSVDISCTDKIKEEEGRTEALVRGIADAFSKRGLKTGGFNAVVTSDVPPGSGLSSSASIEMLICSIFNTFFNDSSQPVVECARISKYAENEYFNKPSGLMDQTACGYGGIISIDFREEGNEVIEPLNFSFKEHGYILAVIKTDSSHADLTFDYSSITEEMGNIAGYFGKSVLREVDENDFYRNIDKLRKQAGGRAVLRAAHFFKENRRVDIMKNALKENCIERYLETAGESGNSSYKYLQNVYSASALQDQATSLAIMLTEDFLSSCPDKEKSRFSHCQGVCRIHGGGFAGTVQAYIPSGCFDNYRNLIEDVFGKDSVIPVKIRNIPGGLVFSQPDSSTTEI